ncbi:VacJ family lipoprotein [Acinetobacter indicus]|uniref:MlaA family lipoprotein n=1 Tax=Acinetobacter indicus TaxID=756892 RepID=UPI000CEC1462|nr:VacJ family lipoprotein [Acinetobacter indicus]MCO8102522.1 VacJ family lipoprotein [Acinetobacter indicus]MDM1263059.1 VacJ family lipoprotein [Acinetobacter indicus]
MRQQQYVWISLLTLGMTSPAFANESAVDSSTRTTAEVDSSAATSKAPSRFESLKELKNIKAQDLKVNANAAQPESVKDPLQPLNRQVYALNDVLDRNIARPLAVQYTEKVPGDVRGSYRNFRKNLGEPWNAVNQLIQGRPLRAAKTLGRFTVNTITTLGLADPARRLGMETEDEDFGTTLGYFGVPSGPYLVLPIIGPSTFRDGFGRLVDSQARPQKYILEDHDGLYWTEQALRGIDARSQILDVEQVLQGDRYAAIRDIYLQRKNFEIAEKKGLEAESISFIEDVEDDYIEDEENFDSPAPLTE